MIHPKLENYFYDDIKIPPLGLAYIAAALRQAHYNDIRIVDAHLSKNQLNYVEEIIREYLPDIVGISVTTAVMGVSLNLAGMVKSIRKDSVVIFGGVHPTLFPEDVARQGYVDYVVCAEAEETIVELVSHIESNREPKGVLGLAYKKGDGVIVNERRPVLNNLDNLPMPAYELFAINRYCHPQMTRKPFMAMFTSRGCPYDCIFCSTHLVMGKRFRAHSPERVFKEMKHLFYALGVREIIFKDSEFTFDPERIEKLCDMLIDEKIDLIWTCNSRIGRLDLALLNKMRKAGCKLIEFGVESTNQQVLDNLKKNTKIQDILNTFKLCQKAGIKKVANLMIGNPGETEWSLNKTLDLIKNGKADYINVGYLIPLPKTELFEMALKNKWLLEGHSYLDAKIDRCIMNATSIETPKLKKMLKKILLSFYLRPAFIWRRIFTLRMQEWKMNIKWFLKLIRL